MLDTRVELEAFSTVVEKIYDAATNPSLWRTALESIVKYIGASGATVSFADTRVINQDPTTLHSFGFTDEFLQYFAEYAGIWGLQCGAHFWKVGEVHHLPDIMPRDEFINGRFYREVLQNYNETDFIGLIALKEGPHVVPFTVSTRTDVGAFEKRSVEAFRLLAPHICKSAKISFALELKKLDSQMMASTLNGLSTAVYIVDSDSRLSFMNTKAIELSKCGRGPKTAKNKLVFEETPAASALQNGKLNDTMASTTSIALPDEFGGLIATFLPLNSGQREAFTMGIAKAGYAIFVQDPMQPPPNPGEGFAKLYDLTRAELRTLMAMTMSQGPQDAADILGVSINTIRSHLQRIFSKTRTSGQSELMQLMMRSAAPVAAQ
jgi:DNA-binding CsgD family transcriptional regulator